MTTRKYYPEVDAKGRIIPEVADGRGVGGRSGLGAAREREFARLGRILEATRDLEGLQALNNLRELVQIPMESGAAARGATAFGPGQVDYLTLPDLRGNQGARSGGIGSLDPFQYGEGEGGQQNARDPFGLGRWGLLSDGEKQVPAWAIDSPRQERRSGTDAGVDAGSDAGVDAGYDAGVDAGRDSGVDAGRDSGVDAGRAPPTREELEESLNALEERLEELRRSLDPVDGPDAGTSSTPSNPDEAGGPDYTGVSARLRVPSNWSPRKTFMPSHARPAGPDDSGRTLAPPISVGGLADEPLRRRFRGPPGPALTARSIGPGANPGPRWGK